MATESKNAVEGRLVLALRRLRREAELLHRALVREEERADSLLQNIIALEKNLPAEGGPPPTAPAGPAAPAAAPAESAFLLKLMAQSGVAKLEFEWLADGAALVRVDGGKAFALPPTVAAFLETLAQDKANSDERLVGWKSREDVRATMQERMRREFSRHAIEELLRRLRAVLTAGGVNPFLIQTHPQFGLRFALRRVRACDEP